MSTVARVLLATGLVLGGFGCAKTDWIDRTLVTEDVTGTWTGATVSSQSNFEVRLELRQQGGTVTGTFQSSTRIANWYVLDGPIEGRVAGNLFMFKDTRGTISGELTISGDEMLGGLSGPSGARQLSLRRESPPSQPGPPIR